MIKKVVLFLSVISMCFIFISCVLNRGNSIASEIEKYKVYETTDTEEYVTFINQINESENLEIIKVISNENNDGKINFIVTYKKSNEIDKRYRYEFVCINGKEEYLSYLDREKDKIVDVYSNDYNIFYITYREEI